jgi:hypothetical protein
VVSVGEKGISPIICVSLVSHEVGRWIRGRASRQSSPARLCCQRDGRVAPMFARLPVPPSVAVGSPASAIVAAAQPATSSKDDVKDHSPRSYTGCSRHGLCLPQMPFLVNNWTYPLFPPPWFLVPSNDAATFCAHTTTVSISSPPKKNPQWHKNSPSNWAARLLGCLHRDSFGGSATTLGFRNGDRRLAETCVLGICGCSARSQSPFLNRAVFWKEAHWWTNRRFPIPPNDPY